MAKVDVSKGSIGVEGKEEIMGIKTKQNREVDIENNKSNQEKNKRTR